MTCAIYSDTPDTPLQAVVPCWHENLEAIARQAGQEPDRIARLVAPALVASPDRLQGTDIHRDPFIGPAVRWAVLHGFTAQQIIDLFQLPSDKVNQYLASAACPTATAQQAVALAKGGRSATEIRQQLNIRGKGWLYRTLDHALVNTNPFGAKAATNTEQRVKAARFYKQGWTYREIAAATGMSMDNVKNTLRAAHKRGDLPEYGSRR